MKRFLLLLLLTLPHAAFAQLTCSGGPCGFPQGSVSAPSVYDATDPTKGMFFSGTGATGAVSVGVNSTDFMDFQATNSDVNVPSGIGLYVRQIGAGATDEALTVNINGGNRWVFDSSGTSYALYPSGNNTTQFGTSGHLVTLGYFTNLVGTTTNNSATTGNIGEYVSSTVATGSSVTTASTSATPITSISLTAGDWDVTGVVDYTPNAATSITLLAQGAQALNGCMTAGPALGAQDTFTQWETAANIIGASDPAWAIPVTRISISTTTTVCLIAKATFSINSLKVYGTIRARRVR